MDEVASMLPNQPASTSTYPRLWLIVGHIVVGLTGAFVVFWLTDRSPTVWAFAFLGIVFGQTSLLGIWGGLGANPWWSRMVGVIVGTGYLFLLLGLGIDELNQRTFIVVVMATMFVMLILLSVRCFGVRIVLDSLPVTSSVRIQFSIRHLFILTFLVACLFTIGKSVQPYIFSGDLPFGLLLFITAAGIAGVLPVWFVLATRQPVPYSIGLVGVEAFAGYYAGRLDALNTESISMMILTSIEALVVVVSLLVVRFCGYRLVRLPPH